MQKILYCRYEPFDFHHECRKMRYDRLQILLDRINPEQEEYGYFLLLKDGSVVQQQDGVFRTNCIDCLDRTNVVQSLLARRNLLQVFQVHASYYPCISKIQYLDRYLIRFVFAVTNRI